MLVPPVTPFYSGAGSNRSWSPVGTAVTLPACWWSREAAGAAMMIGPHSLFCRSVGVPLGIERCRQIDEADELRSVTVGIPAAIALRQLPC
jgi:hypothetical protein